MTQAAQLVKYLRQMRSVVGRWPTYRNLLASGISNCPWKRLAESGHKYLRKGEKLERGKDAQGRVVFKIVRAK